MSFAISYENHICEWYGSILGTNVFIEFVMLEDFVNAFVDAKRY